MVGRAAPTELEQGTADRDGHRCRQQTDRKRSKGEIGHLRQCLPQMSGSGVARLFPTPSAGRPQAKGRCLRPLHFPLVRLFGRRWSERRLDRMSADRSQRSHGTSSRRRRPSRPEPARDADALRELQIRACLVEGDRLRVDGSDTGDCRSSIRSAGFVVHRQGRAFRIAVAGGTVQSDRGTVPCPRRPGCQVEPARLRRLILGIREAAWMVPSRVCLKRSPDSRWSCRRRPARLRVSVSIPVEAFGTNPRPSCLYHLVRSRLGGGVPIGFNRHDQLFGDGCSRFHGDSPSGGMAHARIFPRRKMPWLWPIASLEQAEELGFPPD